MVTGDLSFCASTCCEKAWPGIALLSNNIGNTVFLQVPCYCGARTCANIENAAAPKSGSHNQVGP